MRATPARTACADVVATCTVRPLLPGAGGDHASTVGGQPQLGPARTGRAAPTVGGDPDAPAPEVPVTVGQALPPGVVGAQGEIDDPPSEAVAGAAGHDGHHHRPPFPGPGGQTAGGPRSPRQPPVDDHHVDRAHQRGQHRRPRRRVVRRQRHHGQPVERHPGLGGRGQTQLGQADHHRPRPGLRRRGGGGQGEGGGPRGSGDPHHRPAGQPGIGEQRSQRLGHGEGMVAGQGDRRDPVGQLAQLGGDDHPTSIEQMFDTGKRFSGGPAAARGRRRRTPLRPPSSGSGGWPRPRGRRRPGRSRPR